MINIKYQIVSWFLSYIIGYIYYFLFNITLPKNIFLKILYSFSFVIFLSLFFMYLYYKFVFGFIHYSYFVFWIIGFYSAYKLKLYVKR